MQLVLTRWDVSRPASMSNLVLLSPKQAEQLDVRARGNNETRVPVHVHCVVGSACPVCLLLRCCRRAATVTCSARRSASLWRSARVSSRPCLIAYTSESRKAMANVSSPRLLTVRWLYPVILSSAVHSSPAAARTPFKSCRIAWFCVSNSCLPKCSMSDMMRSVATSLPL